MMATNALKEFRQGLDKRKALFISLGLRPFQILLSVGVLFNLLTAVLWVVYVYSHGYKFGFRVSFWIFKPIVDLLVWFSHFTYLRASFILLALIGAYGIFGLVTPPRADYFSLSFLLGYILITIGAAVSWAKMRDSIFSSKPP